ncbi:MAG TPA: histidine kinase [Terriglobales bacterium]|nr:histidine kinase [Terriglobales bacterium]
MARHWTRWVAYLLSWTLVGLFFASQTYLAYKYSGGNPNLGVILEFSLSEWYIWALLAPVVIWLARRLSLERGRRGRNLAIHAVVSVGVALAHWGLNNLCRHYLLGITGSASLVYTFHSNLVTYWVLVGATCGYDYYVRYRQGELHAAQLSAQLAQVQLQALRTQLHPHFLFNTLNAIATLVHRDPEAADQMIARLSDLLRLTLEGIGVQEVPLAREIEFLKGYLEIEQARFGDRLTVDMQIAPEVLGARIPYLILQPLVENAIRHGIAPRSQPGRVVIRAESDNRFLVLEVRDNGPGLASGSDNPVRQGMGLANTRSRLEKLYGERQRFEMRNGLNGGFVVTLTFPLQSAGAADGDE